MGIDKIKKVALSEYYASLLSKYRSEHQEHYSAKVNVKVKGQFIEQMETRWRETGTTESEELKTISLNIDLEYNIVSIIYSDKFAGNIAKEAKILRENYGDKKDYGYVMTNFQYAFKKALDETGIDMKVNVNINHTCVLYSKLLFAFAYYGKIIRSDSLLCIDEGQDISRLQYALIKKVNGNELKLNIYGDLEQQIPGCCGIDNWSRLSDIIESRTFVLNENYRNSDNIIKFYNENLGINNKSFGLKTKSVEKISIKMLITGIKLQLILKNRTAIITNNPKRLPMEINEICTSEVVEQKKAVLLTVRQAKGLEFDSVFVFDDDLNKNERYIAYSRALSELYIVLEGNAD